MRIIGRIIMTAIGLYMVSNCYPQPLAMDTNRMDNFFPVTQNVSYIYPQELEVPFGWSIPGFLLGASTDRNVFDPQYRLMPNKTLFVWNNESLPKSGYYSTGSVQSMVSTADSSADIYPDGYKNQTGSNDVAIPGGRFSGKIVAVNFPGFSGFMLFFERLSLGYRLLLFLALFAFFFLLNIAFVVFVVVITNRVKNGRAERYALCRSQVIEVLSSLLFNPEEVSTEDQELAENNLRQIISGSDRQVVIDVLMEARRNLTGKSVQVLTRLYTNLQLDRVSLSSTRSINWYRKAMGVRELAYLGENVNRLSLSSFLDSRNPNLRMEAVLGHILIEKEEPFGFLDRLNRPFTRWIQLSAYYTMYFNGVVSPSLIPYLKYPNPEVVLWSLRLAAIYNQVEATIEVSRCLTHEDSRIRRVAVQTSLALENWEIKEMLKERYPAEPLDVRIEIIKYTGYFAGKEDIPFLTGIANSGTFKEIREAVGILYRMDGDARANLLKTNHSLQGKLTPFINYLSDSRNRIAV